MLNYNDTNIVIYPHVAQQLVSLPSVYSPSGSDIRAGYKTYIF